MDRIEVLQDLNARLQMKMTLNADTAVAEQSRLKSRIAYLEGTALPHARKQEHANGFQAGWHSAIDRFREGDTSDELRALVPDSRQVGSHGTPPVSDSGPEMCEWTVDSDEYNGDSWDGSCGGKWCFTEGDPAENNYRFCPQCGRPVRVVVSAGSESED